MGFYVHTSVTFSVNEKEPLMKLASKCLDGWDLKKDDRSTDAYWFLKDVETGRGYVCGPKGALYTWGRVGNYTSGEDFVEALLPFWDVLLGKEADLSFDFDHAVVFIESEQSKQAEAYEIMREGESIEGKIIVKHHELPFCWMQF